MLALRVAAVCMEAFVIEAILSWLVFIVAVMGLVLWAVCGFSWKPKHQDQEAYGNTSHKGLPQPGAETFSLLQVARRLVCWLRGHRWQYLYTRTAHSSGGFYGFWIKTRRCRRCQAMREVQR